MSHFLTLLTSSEQLIPHYGLSLSLSVSCLLSLMCRFWLDPEKRERGLPCCKFPFDCSLHWILGSLFCCSFCFTDDIPLSRPKKKKSRTKTTLGKLFFAVWDHKFFQDLAINSTDQEEAKPQQSQVTAVLRKESGLLWSSEIPGSSEEQGSRQPEECLEGVMK